MRSQRKADGFCARRQLQALEGMRCSQTLKNQQTANSTRLSVRLKAGVRFCIDLLATLPSERCYNPGWATRTLEKQAYMHVIHGV